jgi:hypothetical protein
MAGIELCRFRRNPEREPVASEPDLHPENGAPDRMKVRTEKATGQVIRPVQKSEVKAKKEWAGRPRSQREKREGIP